MCIFTGEDAGVDVSTDMVIDRSVDVGAIFRHCAKH